MSVLPLGRPCGGVGAIIPPSISSARFGRCLPWGSSAFGQPAGSCPLSPAWRQPCRLLPPPRLPRDALTPVGAAASAALAYGLLGLQTLRMVLLAWLQSWIPFPARCSPFSQGGGFGSPSPGLCSCEG